MALQQIRAGSQIQSLSAAESGWIQVSNTSVTAQSSVTISGLSPNVYYRLEFRFIQNTSAGVMQMLFNGDTGGNYAYGGQQTADSAAIANSAVSGRGVTAVTMESDASLVGYTRFGTIDIVTLWGDNKKASFLTRMYSMRNAGNISELHQGGSHYAYTGVDFNSVTLLVTGGTVTGEVILLKRN